MYNTSIVFLLMIHVDMLFTTEQKLLLLLNLWISNSYQKVRAKYQIEHTHCLQHSLPYWQFFVSFTQTEIILAVRSQSVILWNKISHTIQNTCTLTYVANLWGMANTPSI